MTAVEISIPTTSTAEDPSPHTVYHLTVRLPLRTFTLPKRYSAFTALHADLTAQADGAAPPRALPPKTYLRSTFRRPDLIETRRQGLEAYLRAVLDAPDPRWRAAPAWRAFLHLPGAAATTTALHAAVTAPTAPIADPVAWLDAHRELKALLHAARSAIAQRDSSAGGGSGGDPSDGSEGAAALLRSFTDAGPGAAATPAAAHEAAAHAAKQLVRARTLLAPLEEGLAAHGREWSRHRLGEGEVRRRGDLLAAARQELAALDRLLALVRRKGEADDAVAGLKAGSGGGDGENGGIGGIGGSGGKSRDGAGSGARATTGRGKGRVLGRETAATRERDNVGVVQLQQQMMREQDEDVLALGKAVRRQRELAEQIGQELAVQTDLLTLLDEDVDRVQGKLGVASKRVDRIG